MRQATAQKNSNREETGNKTEETASTGTGRTPAEAAYEHGINLQQLDITRSDNAGTGTADITWDVDVTVPPEVRDATTFVATQAHYSNTARLTLCGKMLKCETAHPDFDAKQVASQLSQMAVQELDLWGRYLQRYGQDDRIMNEARHCFDELFTEDDDLAILVGMEAVLVTVAAYFKQIQGFGDPVFQQLVDNGVANRKQQVDMIEQYVQSVLADGTEAQEATVNRTREKYRTLIADHFLVEDNTFIQEPVDLPGLKQEIEDMISQ